MSSPHGDSDKAACSDVRDAQLVADVQTLEIKGNFGDCRKLKAEVEPVSCKLLPVGREVVKMCSEAKEDTVRFVSAVAVSFHAEFSASRTTDCARDEEICKVFFASTCQGYTHLSDCRY